MSRVPDSVKDRLVRTQNTQNVPVVVLHDLAYSCPCHGILVDTLRVEVVQRRGGVGVTVRCCEVKRNLGEAVGKDMS